MSTWDTVNDVFRTAFDDDAIEVTPDTTANDIDAWDSLSHVNLILALESRFGVRFSQKELLTLKNVGDLVRSIESKVGS